MREPPVIWGGCGVCSGGVTSDGFLVWNHAQTVGTFACPPHLRAVTAQVKALQHPLKSVTVETL